MAKTAERGQVSGHRGCTVRVSRGTEAHLALLFDLFDFPWLEKDVRLKKETKPQDKFSAGRRAGLT